jgi:lipopolysaccharide/colanic/teichoic acid biosynthesis glycosyltransferase
MSTFKAIEGKAALERTPLPAPPAAGGRMPAKPPAARRGRIPAHDGVPTAAGGRRHTTGHVASAAGRQILVSGGDPPAAGRLAYAGDSLAVRIFDLSVCLLVLPLVLPLGAIIALLIYIDSPGSVFYSSTRIGRDGYPFRMLKFRKMRRTATGGPLTLGDDERFTPIGSFLSLTKLDELPQLWNVIRGEMHLVGPRPEVPEFVARYPREYREILCALPGITGPAAVEYASESHLLAVQHDPMRYYAEQIMPRKLEIDLEYIRTRTLASDLSLLLRTALVPLAKVMRSSLHNPRARRIEAFLLLGGCAVLAFAFALASSSGS